MGSLEPPAEEKAGQTQPVFLSVDEACPEPQSETTGHLLVEGRKRLGLTREQAASASDIVVSYVEMLESGNYEGISDPLYLMPFLRRYASSLSIDVSDITWRFMRDFNAKENAAFDVWKPNDSLAAHSPEFNSRFLIAAAVLVGVIAAVTLYRAHHAHPAHAPHASVTPHLVSSPTTKPKARPLAATIPEAPSPLATPAATIPSPATSNERVQKRRRVNHHRRHRHLERSSD